MNEEKDKRITRLLAHPSHTHLSGGTDASEKDRPHSAHSRWYWNVLYKGIWFHFVVGETWNQRGLTLRERPSPVMRKVNDSTNTNNVLTYYEPTSWLAADQSHWWATNHTAFPMVRACYYFLKTYRNDGFLSRCFFFYFILLLLLE